MPHDASGAPVAVAGPTMTVGGTLTATGVLFALILAAGWYGWTSVVQTSQILVDANGNDVLDAAGNQTYVNTTSIPSWLILALLVGVGVGLVTAFMPRIARVTAPIYALAYGLILGAVSAVYNQSYNGIVVQAIGATLGVFLVMFVLYATRIVKVTPKFALMVVCATGGIALMYMVTWIASIFGADIAFWNDPTPLGIGISIVVVIVASLNLMLDFNFIERASQEGAPKYMEWYGAFGVTVTIVWLYLEILRLLSLLRQN
ncbi:MAG: Bax inhibitor-1/YccA family protein [Acidobacteria bacterium]|nr:Bax inhibitor-1/YccA family protein [Acidobacteriota bacterium]